MSEAKKIAKDSVYVMGARMISMASSIVMCIILARLMGKELYGLVAWAILLEGVLFIFADAGLQEATARRISEYRIKGRDVSGVVSTGLVLKVILGLTITAMSLIFSSYIAIGLSTHPEALVSVYACAALLFMDTISTSIYSALYGFREMTITSYAEVIQNVSKTFLAVVLVILGFGLQGALTGLVVGSAVLLIFYVYSFKKIVLPEIKHFRLDIGELKFILSYGFYLGLSWAIVKIYMSFDQLYIQAKLSSADFAYYSIAMNLAMFLYFGSFALRRVLLTTFSGSVSTNNYGMTRDMFRMSIKYIALVAIPGGAGLAMVSSELISAVYGYEYIGAAAVLPVLAMMGAIKTCEIPAACIIDGGGKAKISVRIAGVVAVLNIALNLALIPFLGIVGAALASIVSMGGGSLVYIFFASRSFNVPVPLKDLYKVLLASSAMVLSVYFMRLWLYTTGIFNLESFTSSITMMILCVAAGIMVYLASVFILGIINDVDSVKIRKVVGNSAFSRPVMVILNVSDRIRVISPFRYL